ncbi:oligopeptide:H+ symporter [Streptomyces sp. NPDC001508]|uniref:peptide MFS transporter n=1 Tax=Streptomyces sp. NPDC001508 TaxID=3154656 RepID=UPI00332FAA71
MIPSRTGTESGDVKLADGANPSIRTQAPGLWSLAATELWERFSFYGLQGILTFYLLYSVADGGLDFGPGVAASVVGVYGGSVYLAQILGAWLGDRVLSPRNMVLYGAVVITAGHVALAVLSGSFGLVTGLSLIVLGTGALKTNITTILGMLASADRTRRDVGFSYFYMAICIGAVLGPLLTGLTQSIAGFHLAFGLAAIGMVLALAQYVGAMRKLPADAAIVRNPINPAALGVPLLLVAGVIALLVATIGTGLVAADELSLATTIVVVAVAVIYFTVFLTSAKVTPAERVRVRGYLPIFIASALYFGFLYQKFSTIPILITERVNLNVLGWSVPPPWITTASPLAAVLVTPVLARLWSRLGDRQPGPARKIALGLAQVGIAYTLLLLITITTGKTVSPVFMVVVMVIAGSSEMLVGPIGLALVTRAAPSRFRNQFVALNFLTLASGSALGGLLGTYFVDVPEAVYFSTVGAGAMLLGLVTWVLSRRVEPMVETQD